MELFRTILQAPVCTLFAVVAVGLALGSLSVRGIALGPAGVLFAGLLFGHFGATIPRELTELGLVFFVYAVGLQAGPRFVDVFRARGQSFLIVGVVTALLGAVAAVVASRLLGISAPISAGLYCGASTCTPALAAVMDAVRAQGGAHVADVPVGYGVAYPLGVLAPVLAVQLLPTILRIKPSDAARAARKEEVGRAPAIEVRCYRMTNPNCDGRSVAEIAALNLAAAKLSRIKRGGQVMPALPDTRLVLGDLVRAVGAPGELEKLRAVLGEEVDEPMSDPAGVVTSAEVVVSQDRVSGAELQEIDVTERYGVIVTRVRRDGMELTPAPRFVLERGDVLRVVGTREAIDAFAKVVGSEERRLHETSLLPFAAGVVAGAAIGQIPIPLPGGMQTRLGLAGGAFVAAVLLGHFGRIGPVQVYVPDAAKFLARDLGLVIFLAGAGTAAGQNLAPIFALAGPRIVLAGAVVTLVTVASALALLLGVFRWNMLSAAGALGGAMTSSPALSAANRLAYSDAQAIAFASLYPVAIIAKSLLAQVVYLVGRM